MAIIAEGLGADPQEVAFMTFHDFSRGENMSTGWLDDRKKHRKYFMMDCNSTNACVLLCDFFYLFHRGKFDAF